MASPADGFEAVMAAIDPARLTTLLVESVEQYSPSYAEEPAMEIFIAALAETGLPHLRQPVPGREAGDNLGNLIVEWGPQPPAFCWVGHVDTVPAMGDQEPLPRREGDILHGLGTADMKSGCAAIIEALTALRSAGLEPKRGLAVALVVGEEEYGDGSAALLQRVTAPLTVIGEPTGLVPCIDHYAYHEYRLHTGGARSHAALPELGANAIHAMLTWLTALYEAALDPRYADRLALNPRDIRGGGDMFVVAEHCEAAVDIHVRPDVAADEVTLLIEAARDRAATDHPDCRLWYERQYVADGYAIAPLDTRLGPLSRAFARTGEPWKPAAFRSHSDGSMFHAKGVAPVICGPGRLEVAHTRHECVSIGETERAARLYAAMIYEACMV